MNCKDRLDLPRTMAVYLQSNLGNTIETSDKNPAKSNAPMRLRGGGGHAATKITGIVCWSKKHFLISKFDVCRYAKLPIPSSWDEYLNF